jgi:CheY-like chemotaxis protein/anti-sigma regulatory factor (Ser/Thr protein kinase)
LNRIVSNNRLYAKKKSIVLDFRISIANLNRKDEEPTVAVTYEQWEHEYQAIPISCFIDPAKLEQALNNLLTNAIKFSEPKSVVEVRVGRKSNQVYISVKDHGLGIPKDEIPLLFEPYKKISVKPTRGETSTGLGLSIVRAIVLAHDGDVVVESEVGVGSKFTILLPPPSIVSKEPVVTGKDSLTILLADDNVVLQKLVASAFKKRQHHVILASDGNEALQEWEKYKDQINVIIMDEEMPRHNGNEVTELIRAREKELKTRPANIIACTSVAETSHDSLLKAKGANSVLIKPYSLDTLISIVERTNKT